jgi:protease-4
MGTVAASGGYYIAAGTSGIVANPGTITGSIGVLMAYTDLQEIFKKIGLKSVVIKSGDFKDMGSPMREMTDPEKEILQDFVVQIHEQFVRDAALGRDMDPEKIALLADGRIFTGEQAQYFGLVDRLGNLEDAVSWAGELGGIEGKISTIYPSEDPSPVLDYLLESSVRQIVNALVQPRISAKYLYQPGG